MNLERRIAAAIRYMRQWDPDYAEWAEANYRRMLGPYLRGGG